MVRRLLSAGREDTVLNDLDAGFWAAALALLAGIVILIVPRVLNYVVAIYLILIGILGIIPYFNAGG